MKTRSLLLSLVGFALLAVTLLGVNLAAGNTPVLGLDLKGGLSVIYATTEPAEQDQLTIIRDLMRDQLEGFGIAEPDVRVEGENIIVDLPGVTDQEAAFEALQVSGIVTLRPVIQCMATATDAGSVDNPTDGSVPAASTPTGSTPDATAPDATAPDATAPDATAPDGSAPATAPGDTSEGALGAPPARPLGFANPATAGSETTTTTVPTTTVPGSTPESTPDSVPDSTPDSVPDSTPDTVPETVPDTVPDTAPNTLPPGQTILPYPGLGQSCLVGPSGGTGEVFARGSAEAGIDQQTGGWVVTVDLRDDGQAIWNALAAECYNNAPTCPIGPGGRGQLAIVLDDVIQSAPTVQTPNFPGNVQISGNFTEDEVRSLARVLNRGAFPVQVEQQRVETVSATTGKDSLRAAVIAGLIGVAVMLTFMIAYYRKLSVVIIPGLIVWGMAVFSLATFVSRSTNFALTLAGATGIIVAVGVTVDTYVVFFERLRDEQRHGRTLRNAAQRSFQATWRTIVSADLVSLIASIILFWLSVGSVKGFALYLGLTTICDLIVCYFFTRPAVYLLAMNGWLDRRRPATAPAIGAAS